MNVLLADQFGHIGGAQKCLLDLVEGWPASDKVLAAVPDGALAAMLRGARVPTFSIACGPYGLGRKSAADMVRFCTDSARQASVLREFIEQHSIDVAYVNGPRVLAGVAIAAGTRCRVVYHAHNCLSHWYDRAVVRWALSRGATAIACCRHVAGGIGPGAVVVQNGVPDAGFHARRFPSGRPWVLGVVGRISPEKGHLELIDAIRVLAGEEWPLRLLVAGSAQYAPQSCEKAVRLAATGLPIEFTGWTDDVGTILAGLDLLVVPSIAEPGLPRVVLEAFSAGVPVVAAPSGGIPEAIEDGRTGFLARDSTPSSLAECLRRVLTSPSDQLARVASNARAEWERWWNLERWRRHVLSIVRAADTADTLCERGRQRDCVVSQARQR